ncbi:hypothetical protein F5148DRAFT_1186196 [Russula earlei]|uniref:Uncharacterized protein n=1 Tax=Russula earlei TaxID=71964 RepID=A0ACC0UF28_9AGAM|nr:hypothetical protein F5148DRAFT_1186196 [Russula earlei]
MASHGLLEERLAQLDEITRRRNDYLLEMFALLQRRNRVGLVLTMDGHNDPALEAFMDRFNISKAEGAGSISQLADSESIPSPSRLSTPLVTPVSDISRDTPSALPYGSPMSEALSSPSPLPLDTEMDESVAPAEDGEPDLDDSAPRSPDTSMEVTEDASSEIPEDEPPFPSMVDTDRPVDVSAHPPSSSSDIPLAEAHADTSRVDILSVVEDTDEAMGSVAHSEAGPVQPADESDEDSKSEAFLASPVITERIAAQEDMNIDVVGEPRAPIVEPALVAPGSAVPPTSQAFQAKAEGPSPAPPVPPTIVPSPILALHPSAFILPPKPSTEVFIPSALAPISEPNQYALQLASVEPRSLTASEWLNPEFSLNRSYILPPAKTLPLDQQRRLKLGKGLRKKEKEKDKTPECRKDGSDEWTPLGINKWGVTIKANPLWKRVSRATKTMSTRDWNVAFTELRLIRVLERVEQLKETGKWSYRQPKKQRAVGNISKTHWDYLLDEMHWMRADFREERRWKICMAYKLAASALEWHKAGDRQTRRDNGIVVDWSRPILDESRDIDDVEMIIAHGQSAEEEIRDDSDELPLSAALISADYGSDDSDDEQELEKQEVADALEPRAALEEALGHAERSESTQPENEIQPKEEDLDDASVLQAMQQTAVTVNLHPKQDETPGHLVDNVKYPSELNQPSEPDLNPGLKQTSDDPVLGSDNAPETAARSLSTPKHHPKPNIYSPLRSHIAHLDYDRLILDFDDLHLHKPRDAASDDGLHDTHPIPSDILQIFPELPYAFTEPPPSVSPLNLQSGGKKKSEKRDRDDPHKRSDPTTYNKMTAMGSFMRTRPTLLAALNPAVRWENDGWASFDDAPIIPDFDAPYKFPDEPTSSLFDGGRPSLLIPDDDVVLPSAPRDPARRATADALWTNQDDLLLKHLTEKYPKNWGLVADLFNSSRGAIALEKRADWECKERYRSRWLGKDRNESDFTPVTAPAQDGPSSFASARPSQKRMASVSSSTTNTAALPTTTFEPRKRRRHVLIFETMRKCARKREAAQKVAANSRKTSNVHDTHGLLSKLPKLGPAELSRMKAEKEAQELMSRRRAEEAQRQQLLQRMGNGTTSQSHAQAQAQAQAQGQQVQVQQGQPAQQPAQNNNVPRPQLNGQAVPQIRTQVNISQQQRMPATNVTRVSAQLLQQAAQQRALAVVNANMTAAGANISAPHLSPGFAQRAPVSSPVVPQLSPPRTSTTPNPPRPPSASQHQAHAQPSPNLPHAVTTRPNPNPGMYFSSLHGVQFTPEQMEHAMRLQLMHRPTMMQGYAQVQAAQHQAQVLAAQAAQAHAQAQAQTQAQGGAQTGSYQPQS